MPQWNTAQKQAIETRNKNILVSASAGSGKTTVLIARLMARVLEDHVPIQNILAMTFTEAAANEMKKRLADSLQKALSNCGEDDVELKNYILQQISQLEDAHISTIHSFALSIIQKYYYIIGLNPDRIQNILDPSIEVLYQEEAIQYALNKQYASYNETYIKLTELFSARSENDEALCNFIQTLANLANTQSDPSKFLNGLTKPYTIHCFDDLPKNLYEAFQDYYICKIRSYMEKVDYITKLLNERYEDMKESKKTPLYQKQELIHSLYDLLMIGFNYETIATHMRVIPTYIIPPSPSKEDVEYTKLRTSIHDIEDELLNDLYDEATLTKDMRDLYPYVEKIVEMTKDYMNQYDKIKEEANVIDFNDMEHFALEILQAQNHTVAKLYQAQFDEIMVDEFQDSNDVQNTLVQLICRENNVFRVGDIKQSIYGFRHAKPDIMKSIMERNTPNDINIYLNNNYRSKESIIQFNNKFYERLMNVEGFCKNFNDEDIAYSGIPAQKEDNFPIEFHAIDMEYIDQVPTGKTQAYIKADYIAHLIQELKEKHGYKWSDFAILLRGNNHKKTLKDVFDTYHMPCFADIKSGFYQSPAISLTISTLKSIVNPYDNIAFIACMHSPLFNMSLQELAKIRIEMNEFNKTKDDTQQKIYSYYDYMKSHPNEYIEAFDAFRKKCRGARVSHILNHIFDQNNFYIEYVDMQDKTNMDLLFEKAVLFEQQNASGIYGFIHMIESIKELETAQAIPIGNEADVIRVMSIHQSKGLQFKVVFVWSNTIFASPEAGNLGILDDTLGLGFKHLSLPDRYLRDTISTLAIKHYKNRLELEEEMRILYVATTRAQQQMYIVDAWKMKGGDISDLSFSTIFDRKGYTSWILSVFENHPEPLFRSHIIHKPWIVDMIPTEISYHPPLQTYQYSTTQALFTSASQSKRKKLPTNLELNIGGMKYGTTMHKAIELIHDQIPTIPLIENISDQYHLSLNQSQISTILSLYHDPTFISLLKGKCYYELPYMIKGDTNYHGFMDFVSIIDHEIHIVDFKTDHVENGNILITRYREQLDIYAQAMHTIYPDHSIYTYIYSFKLNEMIQL